MRTNRLGFIITLVALPALVFATGQGEAGADATKEMPVISWHQVGNPQERLPDVLEAVNAYLAETVGVQTEIKVHGWGDYNTRMQTMHAAAEPFDLCFTSNWTNDFTSTVRRGAYTPLDELLAKHGQGILDTVDERYWEVARIDGQIMAVINLQIMSNQMGIGVAKRYADKYGFDPSQITRNDQIFDFLRQVRDNEKDVVPLLNEYMFYPNINSSMKTPLDTLTYYMAVRDNANGPPTVVNYVATPEYRLEQQTLRTALAEDLVPPDVLTLEVEQEASSGRYAAWRIPRVKPGVAAEAVQRYGQEVVVLPLHRAKIETGSVQSTMTAIGANSEHPEAAMRLYNAVFTDTQLYNMLVFGVEGVHYTDLGDGYVEPIQENAYGLPAWQFGSQFNAYLLPGQSETVWEDTIAFDEAAYTTSLFGFTFDPSPVRNEATACASIYVENRPSVIHAEDFDAAMSDFVQALEDAGIQKVMDEAQRQINAWWASK